MRKGHQAPLRRGTAIPIHPGKGQADRDNPKEACGGIEEEGGEPAGFGEDGDGQPHHQKRVDNDPNEDEDGAD